MNVICGVILYLGVQQDICVLPSILRSLGWVLWFFYTTNVLVVHKPWSSWHCQITAVL